MGKRERASSALSRGALRAARSTPKTLGDLNNSSDHPNGGGGCIVHLPPSVVMHALYVHATEATKRSNAAKATTTDQTDQKEETPKPERKTEEVGCESGT